jgi:hypothetical protein
MFPDFTEIDREREWKTLQKDKTDSWVHYTPKKEKVDIVFYHTELWEGEMNAIWTTVNGEELPLCNIDVESQVEQILQHLGYDVDIISKDSDGEW